MNHSPENRVGTNVDNYIGYGSLTPAVARVLLRKPLPTIKVFVPEYELRILTTDFMTEAERLVMEGQTERYIALYNPGAKGLDGWVYMKLLPDEIELLKKFDVSNPSDYHTEIVRFERKKLIGTGLMVVRNEYYFGRRVKPQGYKPYRPFSFNPRVGRERAKAVAETIREAWLEGQ